MNKFLLIVVALIAVSSIWAYCSGMKKYLFPLVDCDEFARLIDDADRVALLDVRTQEEYSQGHIAGAVLADVNKDDFLKNVAEMIPEELPIAVYCRSGRRSANAATSLEKEGYKVTNLSGGILAWQKAGLPMQTTQSGEYIHESTVNIDVNGEPTALKVIRINARKTQFNLRMFSRPSITNPQNLLAIEAAFTGKLIEDDSHFTPMNICGDYVIDGKRYDGYEETTTTTGCLAISGTGAKVCRVNEELITETMQAGGTLFQQILLVENGRDCYVDRQPKKRTDVEFYRSVVQMSDGEICIVQSADEIDLTRFIAALCALGAQSAIYLDMGAGWNYGWYRTAPADEPKLLFPVARKTRYQTNWLVVRPKPISEFEQ